MQSASVSITGEKSRQAAQSLWPGMRTPTGTPSPLHISVLVIDNEHSSDHPNFITKNGKIAGSDREPLYRSDGRTIRRFQIPLCPENTDEIQRTSQVPGRSVYVSSALYLNQVSGRKSRVKYSTCSFVDLDIYKSELLSGLSVEDAARILLEIIEQRKIPTPSQIWSSGRGLYLFWQFDHPVYSPRNPIGRSNWAVVEDFNRYVVEKLKDCGADRQSIDCTRVLRALGSRNPKNGKLVEILHDANLYWSPDILEKFVERKQRKKAFQRPQNADTGFWRPWNCLGWQKASKGNPRSSQHIRYVDYLRELIEDIKRLIVIRWNGRVPEGHRNTFCHIVSWALSRLPEVGDIINATRVRLSGLVDDGYLYSSEFEQHRRTQIARKKSNTQYVYSREKLISILEVTDAEAKEMTYLLTDAVHRDKRLSYMRNRRIALSPHKAKKPSAKETKPWEICGVSRATFYRRKTFYLGLFRKKTKELKEQEKLERRAVRQKNADVNLLAAQAFKGYNPAKDENKSDLRMRISIKNRLVRQLRSIPADIFYKMHPLPEIAKLRMSAKKRRQAARVKSLLKISCYPEDQFVKTG